MAGHLVSVVRYDKPLDSVRVAVELCRGLAGLKTGDKVFIKPNVVFWSKAVPLPKWGVITTSRIVEDMVVLLKEAGAGEIAIGEGMVTLKPNDRQTVTHAFETLGYYRLARRYGVKVVDLMAGRFDQIEVAPGFSLGFSREALETDFLVNLPVLKTHAQTVVSLGLKNLKGLLDLRSRKHCHDPNRGLGLDLNVARLHELVPSGLTLIDGIYSLERGPGFDGKARRTNLLTASADALSADLVGASVLGHPPAEVPLLVEAARRQERAADLGDVEVRGEKIEDVAAFHPHDFPYNEDGTLPLALARMGIEGLSYRRYDSTICTYCAVLNGLVIAAVARAWKGTPWPDVEILTGKVMDPEPGKRTVLLGKCLYQRHRGRPDFGDMIAVGSCPPKVGEVVRALHRAGLEIDPIHLEDIEKAPAMHLRKYQGRKEFDEAFFRVD